MACSATQAGGGAAETAGSECRIEGSVVVHAAGLGGKRWGAAVFCSTCGGGAGEVHGSLALAARTCMALFSNTWHLRGTHRGPATRNTSRRCCRRNVSRCSETMLQEKRCCRRNAGGGYCNLVCAWVFSVSLRETARALPPLRTVLEHVDPLVEPHVCARCSSRTTSLVP